MSTRQKNEALEDHLINFTIAVNDLIESLPNTNLDINLKNQLSRSSLSPSINYGEVQTAEATKDFIHKMGVVLKELRETYSGLKIIQKGNLIPNRKEKTVELLVEANELISIFVASIKTSKKRL